MQATDEDLADLARVMNARGYLVAATARTYKVGEIFTNGRSGDERDIAIGHPFAVLSETDRADWVEHNAELGRVSKRPLPKAYDRFYRVTTD